MKERKLTIGEFPVRADTLTDLLKRVLSKQITIKSAREVFLDLLGGALAETPVPASVDRVARSFGRRASKSFRTRGALLAAINEVIGKNAKIVADYKSGKQAAAGALIGQVMKLVKGCRRHRRSPTHPQATRRG